MPRKLQWRPSSSLYSFSSTSVSNTTVSTGSNSSIADSLRTATSSGRWSYSTKDSFHRDIGMLSGKAILAIGKAQIAAIKWLWVRYRRRVIESRFPYEDQDEIKGLDEMCDDLVDFCREDVYNQHDAEWAQWTIITQVLTGPLDELVRALARSPMSVRLPVLYTLCRNFWRNWREDETDSLERWNEFARPIVQKILRHYETHLNLLDATLTGILGGFSIMWPKDDAQSELWMSRFSLSLKDYGADYTRKKDLSQSIFSIWILLQRFCTQGLFEIAEPTLWKVLHASKRIWGPHEWLTLDSAYTLVQGLEAQKRFREAESLHRSRLQSFQRSGITMDKLRSRTLLELANNLKEQDRSAEAEQYYRSWCSWTSQQTNDINNLADQLNNEDESSESEVLRWMNVELHSASRSLTQGFAVPGPSTDVASFYQKHLEECEKVHGTSDPRTRAAFLALVKALNDDGRSEEVRKWIAQAHKGDRSTAAVRVYHSIAPRAEKDVDGETLMPVEREELMKDAPSEIALVRGQRHIFIRPDDLGTKEQREQLVGINEVEEEEEHW